MAHENRAANRPQSSATVPFSKARANTPAFEYMAEAHLVKNNLLEQTTKSPHAFMMVYKDRVLLEHNYGTGPDVMRQHTERMIASA